MKQSKELKIQFRAAGQKEAPYETAFRLFKSVVALKVDRELEVGQMYSVWVDNDKDVISLNILLYIREDGTGYEYLVGYRGNSHPKVGDRTEPVGAFREKSLILSIWQIPSPDEIKAQELPLWYEEDLVKPIIK
ncbi:MAG TPA: hypothetical protein VGK47_14185 [Nitrososphaeraceae archaeon]